MNTERALSVAGLIRLLGRVSGRKRLQKIVHMLGAAGHREFSHRFVLHYYGPFSREVAEQIDFLVNAGLVDEERKGMAFEYSFIENAQESSFVPTPEDTTWAPLASSLNKQATSTLEAASTIVFLVTGNKCPPGNLEAEFARIKPGLRQEFGRAQEVARAAKLT